MDASSMINRQDAGGTVVMTTRKRLQGVSIGRIAVIAFACLVQAILLLGFVAMTLGLGAGGPSGVGPDRPPPPVMAPATR